MKTEKAQFKTFNDFVKRASRSFKVDYDKANEIIYKFLERWNWDTLDVVIFINHCDWPHIPITSNQQKGRPSCSIPDCSKCLHRHCPKQIRLAEPKLCLVDLLPLSERAIQYRLAKIRETSESCGYDFYPKDGDIIWYDSGYRKSRKPNLQTIFHFSKAEEWNPDETDIKRMSFEHKFRSSIRGYYGVGKYSKIMSGDLIERLEYNKIL